MSATKSNAKKNLLWIVVFALTITAFLFVFKELGLFPISSHVLFISRWVTIACLFLYALKRRSMTAWILISMVIGAEIGNDFPQVGIALRTVSLCFLRLIKTIIAPLLFSTLVVGIAGHSDLKQVGRMGIKSLVYFEIVTTLALLIGLAAINISQAGTGITMPPPPAGTQLPEVVKQTPSEIITHIFPENIAKAVAEGQILQVVVFAVLFGIALALVPEAKRRPILTVTESLSEVMFKFTNIVMLFAPFGVGAAIAYTVGHMGLGILANLFKMLLTFYVAIILFVFCVLLPVALIIKLPIKKFINAIAGPAILAFATTSSEAALPRAMEAMEAIGVPRKTVAFVMPTGYSFNLDGSSLYLSLAAVFVAQAAGIHMSFTQQALMVFTLMLTSKGVAGVPRASLVILLGTVSTFNLPIEPVFILLGIDELMDMGRTTINVVGNSLAAAVIAVWEKEFGKASPDKIIKESIED
ncbi:MAG: dicarboxylate/amino acid:cation symporter [Candidatus Omnitrophota bacterium]